MMSRLALICISFAVLATATSLVAQENRNRSAGADEATVTRADLGWAYLRLERVYFADQPTDNDRIAELNQAFDAASKKFFGRQFGATVQEVNELTGSLLAGELTNGLEVAMSLKPVITPPILNLHQSPSVQLRLTSIYPVDVASETELRVSLKPVAGGDTVVSFPLPLTKDPEGGIDTTIEIGGTTKLDAGAYSIMLAEGADSGIDVGLLNVVSSSPNAVRDANTQRLDAIESDQPAILAAIRACRSRNDLLQDEPSSDSSSQFLTDLSQLASQVGKEIESLESGQDPYQGRSGDYWRSFSSTDKEKPVPARIYAPRQAIGGQPVPLVIVLHGAGGDENMFFTGYGAGKIKELADQHRFVVVSPATNAVSGRSERFDNLVSEISSDYSIDPEAIFVIGHSMGGFATATLAGKRSEQIAAACCIAGGGKPASDKIPPMLMIAGELDSLIPLQMLKPLAQQAIKSGLPVEFRQKDHYGHTLMVGAVLPEAVDWLLKHRPDAAR